MKVAGVGTAFPRYRYTTSQILEYASSYLAPFPEELELFLRFARNAQVKERYFAVPLEKVLDLGDVEQRASFFRELGTELACEAARRALASAQLDPKEVTALLFTSCSLPVIPSIDTSIAQTLNLPPNVRRLPFYQFGCAGGAAGLAVGKDLTGLPGQKLLVSLELCSLVFQRRDVSAASLVGNALFGDGAACVVLGEGIGRASIENAETYLIPGTQGLMGYDLKNDGSHLLLQKELPEAILLHAPALVGSYLSRTRLSQSGLKGWLIHPGGARILRLLEDSMGLSKAQTRWSWEVLERYGNMSSVTILAVLQSFLDDPTVARGDRAVILGIGPGLTVELLTIRVE